MRGLPPDLVAGCPVRLHLAGAPGAATGGVITSAGLVLAGTFAMLGTLPLVEFTEIGFAVALGVLLDTIRGPLGARDGAEPGHRTARLVAQRAGSAPAPGLPPPGRQSALANPESGAVTGGT